MRRSRKCGIVKLDESCISNPKAEIGNWTRPHFNAGKSDLNFRLSDLKCRIRPISQFLLFALAFTFGCAARAGKTVGTAAPVPTVAELDNVRPDVQEVKV